MFSVIYLVFPVNLHSNYERNIITIDVSGFVLFIKTGCNLIVYIPIHTYLFNLLI